ncbi:MAG: NADH-quinone oxidoreductase subunit J, partial [Prevotella sp.]|nr:NADH-quinone oxidoreductase subunit J [Prevotella sp.]
MEQVGSIVMYLIIALAIIVFSVMAVTERRILRAATYLLFTLFAAAGIYFMLDYQFLGAVQIAVYAGGIMVLFVFAILLTHKPGEKTALLSSKKKALGAIAALLCAVVSGVAVFTQLSFPTARLGE